MGEEVERMVGMFGTDIDLTFFENFHSFCRDISKRLFVE